ncbi:Zn-ribbon domain-containing OB-fold protein [Rhodococcus daqingensis]|uniref:Zn-ribbon domain-containing OB-fold protein n=1 Tax=Rhodococcus daqingensis TaxID=2479363 RepID=A0ABW2RZK9_9NOCA
MQNSPSLMIRRCARCEILLAPDSMCTSCGGDELSRVPSSGLGSVKTWTVLDRAPSDSTDTEPLPSVLAVVELDEGPWICTWLEGEIALERDQQIRVQFHHRVSGERYPVFGRSAAQSAG